MSKIIKLNLSAGGVAPIPLYLDKTCEIALGSELNTKTVDMIVRTALSEISPISDARGSSEYKKLLFKQLVYTHFNTYSPGLINMESIK